MLDNQAPVRFFFIIWGIGSSDSTLFSFHMFYISICTDAMSETAGEGRRLSKLLEDDDDFSFLRCLFRLSSCVPSDLLCSFLARFRISRSTDASDTNGEVGLKARKLWLHSNNVDLDWFLLDLCSNEFCKVPRNRDDVRAQLVKTSTNVEGFVYFLCCSDTCRLMHHVGSIWLRPSPQNISKHS